GGNKPEIVTCTHEEIAVAIAHGYTKVTGKPMAAIVHDVVGLLHAAMAIYYAHIDRVPVLILGATGPLDRSRRRPYIDWIHSALVQGNAVRDYVKWDDQPASVADFGSSFARGYRIATQEPAGPVYLCYDAGLQEDELATPVSVAAEIAAARPTPVQADPTALEHAAHLIAHAERPVIVAEFAGRHPAAFSELRRLAELLGAPVIDLQGRLNMATRHPLNFAGSDEVLAHADLVLSVDVGDLFRALNRLDRSTHEKQRRIPEGCTIIDLGLMELRSSKWSEDLGQFQPVDLSIVADSALALPALRELIAEDASALWPGRRARMEQANAKLRADVQTKSREHWDDSPIWPARLASEVWDAIKDEDWVLTGADLEDWTWKLWDIDSPVRWPGRSLGTATQIGTSIGVALAHRGDGKLIVDIQPDGDLLFDPGALWTVANLRLPMLLVMYNNRAYYNDWEHQLRVADRRGTDKSKANIGMDLSDPAPDFAMLAKSFGWYSEGPIADPTDVGPALRRAINVIRKDGRPALLDTIVRKRELARFR
ncbi:MAG: acetolactate synthase large subunit, partial [Chloroflexota bacterium]|nr:acetolactate synthase large subunit [Chloroflexota bacterium]